MCTSCSYRDIVPSSKYVCIDSVYRYTQHTAPTISTWTALYARPTLQYFHSPPPFSFLQQTRILIWRRLFLFLFFGTNGNSITVIGSVTLTYIYLFPLWTSNEKKNRKETKSIVIQKHFRKTFRNDDNGENIYLDIYIYLSDAIHGHNLVSQIFTINILYIYYLEMWRNRKASNENDAFFRRNQ